MANKNLDLVKQKVFEYMVIKHPTVKEKEEGACSEVIVQLQHLCADDDRAAFVRASREIPEEHMKHEARLEVVIRPF